MARDLEEAAAAQRSKDQNSARLSEELGSSQARAVQAEARLAAQTKQMQRDLTELSEKHKEEVRGHCDGAEACSC